MALCFSAIGCDAAVQELSKAVVSYLADLAFSLVLHICPPLFPFSIFVFSYVFPGRVRPCQRSAGDGLTGFALTLDFLLPSIQPTTSLRKLLEKKIF